MKNKEFTHESTGDTCMEDCQLWSCPCGATLKDCAGSLEEWKLRHEGCLAIEPRDRSRHDLLRDSLNCILEIEQIFIDADSWNRNVRKADEKPINPDPDGVMAGNWLRFRQSGRDMQDRFKSVMEMHFSRFASESLKTEIYGEIGRYADPFLTWMVALDQEVRKQHENIQVHFDLRPCNWECWREAYEDGDSPEDAVRTNIEALMDMQ